MRKNILGIVLRILLIAAIIIGLYQHFYIKDFRILVPDILYVSDQPRGMDYMRLHYKYHIATIVNVRSATEHMEKNWRNEELLWTKEHAVRYFEIPIDKENYFPDTERQNTFLAIMSNKEYQPILLHGASDDKRVAMLTAVWFRKKLGYTAEDTLIRIKKIIDDRPLTQQEIDFVKNLQ
jgi:hypothetical protein